MKILSLITPNSTNEIDWTKTQYLIKKDTDKESPTIVLYRSDWYSNNSEFLGICFPCKEYPEGEGGGGGGGWCVWSKKEFLPFTGKAVLTIENK